MLAKWVFHFMVPFTESQSSKGWKGTLKIIWFNPPAQALPGPCPDDFLTFSRGEIPLPFWATFSS